MLPERMSNVTLLCRKEDTAQVIDLLATLKAVHLSDHRRETVGGATVDIGTPFATAEELSSILLSTRNILAKLPPAQATENHLSVQSRIAKLRSITENYAQEELRRASIKEELAQINEQLHLLSLFSVTPIETLFTARSVENILVKQGELPDIACVAKQQNDRAVLFTVLKKDAAKAREQLPKAALIDLSPLQQLRGSQAHVISSLETRKQLLEHERHTDFTIFTGFLQESERIFAFELLKAQAPLHFGTTKHITVVRGFIPTKKVAALENGLKERNINALLDTSPAEEAPVALKNKRPASNFEALIRLYALPRYSEIDPTSLMAFTFPLFFGFMLGDVGYGVCALVIFALLRTMYPQFKEFMNILLISAISTVVFGFIYGEVFGSTSFMGFHLTPLLHRVENIMLMFGIAIVIGLIHINIGLIMGMYNERHHGWFFAFIKKASWIVMQVGLILLVVSLGWVNFPALQTNIIIPLIILGIAITALWYTEEGKGIVKSKGIIEALLGMGNIISYTRLVALGLASVYMAFVINQIAGDLFVKGGVWIVFGIIILLAGHTFNLLLGLLGPFLHSLRLHYVEFFTKFYEGGGKAYNPFGGEQW